MIHDFEPEYTNTAENHEYMKQENEYYDTVIVMDMIHTGKRNISYLSGKINVEAFCSQLAQDIKLK